MTHEDIRAAFQTFATDPSVAQALILIRFTDGKSISVDNGLTVQEAEEMMAYFRRWLDKCSQRIV